MRITRRHGDRYNTRGQGEELMAWLFVAFLATCLVMAPFVLLWELTSRL